MKTTIQLDEDDLKRAITFWLGREMGKVVEGVRFVVTPGDASGDPRESQFSLLAYAEVDVQN